MFNFAYAQCDMPDNTLSIDGSDIWYNSTDDIGGFQFSVDGATINGLSITDFNQATINGTTYDIVDYATDESWGPRFDPNREVLHWDAFDPEFPEAFLNPRAWVYPEGDDAESFFRTGVSTNNSVAFSNGNENSTYRVSIANVKTEGIVPNSDLNKTTVNFNGSTKIGERLEVNATINYTTTEGFNRPAFGYTGDGVIQQFYQFGQIIYISKHGIPVSYLFFQLSQGSHAVLGNFRIDPEFG